MQYCSSRPVLLHGFILAILLSAAVLPVRATGSETSIQDRLFEGIQKQLVKDGFDPKAVKQTYLNPKVRLEIKTVSIYFRHREGKLNYDQFTTQKSIKKV
nr:hypothetical protein [Deltaproteobacteria bacterium]